jgi:hypothetical protein
MKFPGPEQLENMSKLFKLALVNPAKTLELEILSFNQMATILFEWYNKSQIRIPGMDTGVTVKNDSSIDPPINGFGDDEFDVNMDFEDLPPHVQDALRKLMSLTKDFEDNTNDDDSDATS